MQDIANKIVSRIYGHGKGWCFTPKDFADLGSTESVRIKLFRLAKQQIIRRLAKGLYGYPEKHEQLGLLSPSPDAEAEALARHDRIRVQPTGAYAANLLGLSEQVPAKVVYLTEGRARRVKLGNREIRLKQTTPQHMATAGRISGTVIQALRYIGKDRLTAEHGRTLQRKLSTADKMCLSADLIHAPAWMHKWLRQICEEKRSNA
jgi:Family of unknown function (DUF6088)